MRCSPCAICGLVVIAAVISPAAADPPARLPASDLASHAPTPGALEAVTAGISVQAGPGAEALAGQFDLATLHTAAARIEGPTPAMAPIEIDVLVAYTDRAASHYVNIERELISVAIERANLSFRLSNLGHIRLRRVHAYRTAYVEHELDTHFDHVWRFADKGDGYMDEVHDLRDRHRADVAILIVDDAKGCGLATRVRADADEAFAVVHHACAAANFTLAHEVGHIIGASHDLAYANGSKWRDIMSYKQRCGNCPRLPIWSNPLVLVAGEPAGTAQLNNARVIAEQAPRVAAFR